MLPYTTIFRREFKEQAAKYGGQSAGARRAERLFCKKIAENTLHAPRFVV